MHHLPLLNLFRCHLQSKLPRLCYTHRYLRTRRLSTLIHRGTNYWKCSETLCALERGPSYKSPIPVCFYHLKYIAVRSVSETYYIQPALVTMKVDSPAFHALLTPELCKLIKLFEQFGYELRIAGGAVRDLLMGKTSDDVDLATTATPTQMKEMFEKEKIRMLNMKGEKHGTITCRINDKVIVEFY